jgi:hypothetical protein
MTQSVCWVIVFVARPALIEFGEDPGARSRVQAGSTLCRLPTRDAYLLRDPEDSTERPHRSLERSPLVIFELTLCRSQRLSSLAGKKMPWPRGQGWGVADLKKLGRGWRDLVECWPGMFLLAKDDVDFRVCWHRNNDPAACVQSHQFRIARSAYVLR